MSENYAILRMRKLQKGSRGKNSLGVCLRHLDRHLESAEISHPERTEENDTWQSVKNVKQTVSDAIETHNKNSKRAIRKDASVAAEFVFTHSPDADIDPDDFEERVFNFIKEEFPSAKVLRMDYHADEKTQHWHLIVLPTTGRGTLSAKEVFGGPADMRKHQDHFAEMVADLGLKRGISKEVRKNKGENVHNETLRRWKAKQSERLDDEIMSKMKELNRLAKEITEKQKEISKKQEELARIADDVLGDDGPGGYDFGR